VVVDVYFVHHSRNIVVAMDNEITLDLSGDVMREAEENRQKEVDRIATHCQFGVGSPSDCIAAKQKQNQMNWDQLYVETYRRFDCDDLSHIVAYHRGFGKFDLKKRKKKQRNVETTLSRFRSLMESPNPPRTKEVAVKALSPVVAYLLWSVFKFLAIQIIEWAWDRYHEQQTELAAGKVK
jgi:hypothetical protein